MTQLIQKLILQIQPLLEASQQSWLEQAILAIRNTKADTDALELELLNQSVFVKRKFSQAVELDNPFQSFTLAELVRMYLLAQAGHTLELLVGRDNSQASGQSLKTLLKNYYQLGDESEKCALLKSLPFIDIEGVAVQTAIKAGRCNSLIEYSAIALNNPYPAQFFPELNFNQLVLKSLFMGLDIQAINQLDTRLNVKLSNMCFSYAIEQALADRVPPASIWLAIQFADLDDENRAQVAHYLQHFFTCDPTHKKQIEQVLSEQNATHLLA